jgi:ATP-dependent RNA helicase DeaD
MEAEKKAVRFDELNLSEEVQRAITEMGYEEASAIQAAAIPMLLAGNDVIGQAQTGTGKTAAFSIPAIEGVNADSRDVQVLVLCPTRELAVQVSGEIQKLGKYKRGLMVVPIYGGSPYDRQLRALERGVQIVIGTPGRVMDHIERGTLKLENTTKIILDEADEMLDMGFRDDIEFILSKMPKERQTVFFSATMSKPIMELTKKYQRDPQIVKVNHQTMTVTNIEQSYYEVRGPQKKDVLTRLLDMYNLKSTIVFANTKRMVDEIVADLASQRLLRRRPARRHGPAAAPKHAGQVPQDDAGSAGSHRRSRPRHRRRQRGSRNQLRPARRRRVLRAPHRPHGPRRQVGQSLHVCERPRHLQAARHHALHQGPD